MAPFKIIYYFTKHNYVFTKFRYTGCARGNLYLCGNVTEQQENYGSLRRTIPYFSLPYMAPYDTITFKYKTTNIKNYDCAATSVLIPRVAVLYLDSNRIYCTYSVNGEI
jgi:hypothetical protein